jgi:hypothetical protein
MKEEMKKIKGLQVWRTVVTHYILYRYGTLYSHIVSYRYRVL